MCFEDCLVASITAQELEDDLAGVDTSVGDLIRAEEVEAMARKTWYFGESLMTKRMISKLEREWMISVGRAKPLQGETVPSPGKGYAMVFEDYFSCGIHLSSIKFLTLSKFYWACESYDPQLDLDTFCTYYELQR
jgi:hypothetical protein